MSCIGSLSNALRKTGRGNDRVWKAWKAIRPAFHPSHTLWKSLRDYHIPTAFDDETNVLRSKAKTNPTLN
jgi:hypothetical protein